MQLVIVVLAFLCAIVSAMPVNFVKRDVWAPRITSPSEGTVWLAGGRYTVTWDASNPPAQITNPIGRVVLRNTNGFVSGVGGLNEPLAKGFELSDGIVEVEVPSNVPSGTDYQVVLFGDSGNESPSFTIANPMVQISLDI